MSGSSSSATACSGLVVADWLYERFPNEPEGKMSRRYNALVARETCAEVGRALDLPRIIRLGKQAREDHANLSDNVVGDVVEALIGAMFLDGGIERAEPSSAPIGRVPRRPAAAPVHPKSALQELAAERKYPASALRDAVPLRPASCAALQGQGQPWAPRRGRGRRRFQAGSGNRRRCRAAGEDSMTRCGLVAVLGAPNAGKSTLVNALVGQKVAIVSPKAQTTRARLMGIAIEGEAQILLVDTPGIFAPNRRLDRAMVKAAWEGADDADRVVLVIDAAAKVGAKVEQIIEGVEAPPEPRILVLNKVDIAKKDDLLVLAARLSERLKPKRSS